jgi:hypothetical protein
VGKPVSLTDLNGRQTQLAYTTDPLDRLTQVTLGTGAITTYTYPSPTKVVTVSDQTISGDQLLKSQQLYDGLGRPSESDAFESGSQYIATTVTYDALGRIATTTNPSRPGDGLNYATTFSYDALGRQTSVKTYDGSATTASYSGNQNDGHRSGRPRKSIYVRCVWQNHECAGRSINLEILDGLPLRFFEQFDLCVPGFDRVADQLRHDSAPRTQLYL